MILIIHNLIYINKEIHFIMNFLLNNMIWEHLTNYEMSLRDSYDSGHDHINRSQHSLGKPSENWVMKKQHGGK